MRLLLRDGQGQSCSINWLDLYHIFSHLCSSFISEESHDKTIKTINMQSFIVFSAVLACAFAAPQFAGHLTSSQYHAQDELGQYSYGYAGGPSAKSESKDAFGNVRGAYSYIDANGIQQTVNYVADPVNGFRVAATNLPVGPAPAVPVAHQVLHAGPAPLTYAAVHPGAVHIAAVPQPVQDTLEVAVAKQQHFAAHAEANLRSG